MSTQGESGIVEALDEEQTGLRLVFTWIGDRFNHRVERVVCGEVVGAWHSVESDSSTTWPTSPPLQQLSIEPIEETPVAFGVGSAGVSYWSMAASPVIRDDSPAICFDVALKLPQNTDLGNVAPISTYEGTGEPPSVFPSNDVAETNLTQEALQLQVRAANTEGKPIRWAYLFT